MIWFEVSLNRTITLFYVPGLAIGQLYSNSVLALLNNQAQIASGRNTHSDNWDTFSLE